VSPEPVRILGIDPGTLACGYGIIDALGTEARPVDFGVIKTGRRPLPQRLRIVFDGIQTLVTRYEPDVAAVEGAFFGKNVRAALRIGEGRGVAIAAAAKAGLEVFEYAPAAVKKAVVGNGRAHKSQVQQMVKLLLNLREAPEPEDAADALAIALCHQHRLGQAGG
jgi:crossover junction endodeoxyribonuclease RuvC